MLATGGILLVAWAANASNGGASGGGSNNGGYTVSPANEFQMLTDLIVDKYESRYVKDRTEESKYVLTKKYYPHIDIKNLTKEIAYPIIKRDYWERIKATNFNSNIYSVRYGNKSRSTDRDKDHTKTWGCNAGWQGRGANARRSDDPNA